MRSWLVVVLLGRLAKLIDVKSIVTLSIVFTYLALAIMRVVHADKLESIVFIVVSFYFGTQYQKKVEK